MPVTSSAIAHLAVEKLLPQDLFLPRRVTTLVALTVATRSKIPTTPKTGSKRLTTSAPAQAPARSHEYNKASPSPSPDLTPPDSRMNLLASENSEPPTTPDKKLTKKIQNPFVNEGIGRPEE